MKTEHTNPSATSFAQAETKPCGPVAAISPASLPCVLRVAIMALILVASGPAYAKDTLIIGITQFPSTLNPHFDSMFAKSFVLGMTSRPFTVYDKDWKLVCLLCTEVPTMENGKAIVETYGDGKQGIAVTYEIDPEARWGDGMPVSSNDVAFTIEAGKHPESGMIGSQEYRRIRSVDIIDEKTFTLHIDRITYDYNALGLQPLPEHIEKANFDNPREYRNRSAYDTDSYNPALYYGPYRVTRIEPGAYIELQPNDLWAGQSPHFDKIIVRIIENTAALEANLESGSIDYIDGVLGLTADQALAFRKRYPDKYNYNFRVGLIYEHIDLNLTNPILSDLRVRQALLLSIDREAISQQLFEGVQPVAHVFVNPLDSIYHENAMRYPYDPDAAAALLDEAGWNDMRDGIRHNSEGQPLRLEFGTTAGSRVRETVQQVVQSQWRRSGIDVRIRNQPARVFFGETVLKRQFGGMAMFAWIVSPESSPRDILHSDHIPTEQNNYSGSNYMSYQNPVMDELIDAVEVELNFQKRKKIWAAIQDEYVNDLPVLPLYYRANPYIIPKWLKGIEPTGNTAPTTYWVEHWTVER